MLLNLTVNAELAEIIKLLADKSNCTEQELCIGFIEDMARCAMNDSELLGIHETDQP
jgi:hypothetical protein